MGGKWRRVKVGKDESGQDWRDKNENGISGF